MKYNNNFGYLVNKINDLSPSQGGVFTFSDLWNMIGLKTSDRNAKVINRLVREGILYKIRRGIYTTRDPDLWVLASRLKKKSCVSMDSALAKSALIGPLPTSVCLIHSGPPQIVDTPFGQLRYFKIKKELIFGIWKMPNGVKVADNEKAYLDLLYYHCHGARFVVDPITDVHLWRLDRKKMEKYLQAYKNPKFRKFAEGLLK